MFAFNQLKRPSYVHELLYTVMQPAYGQTFDVPNIRWSSRKQNGFKIHVDLSPFPEKIMDEIIAV